MTDLRDPSNLTAFLTRHGLGADDDAEVEVLSGGVSSLAVRVRTRTGSLVVKQALARLAVADDWRADPARALTEARCGEALCRLLPGRVPLVMAVDPQVRAYAMEAAPDGSHTWKQELLAGTVDLGLAREVGRLLAHLHVRSARDPELATDFADRSHFEALRVAPYLQQVAVRHPDLAAHLETAIAAVRAPGSCLVHGDFSPKNLLVTPQRTLLLIDHEVAHWGRPAFDLAFVLSHLCLKAFARPHQAADFVGAARELVACYESAEGLAGRDRGTTALLLAALLLARIDGKSPVEYLDEPARKAVRSLSRWLIRSGASLEVVFRAVAERAGGSSR